MEVKRHYADPTPERAPNTVSAHDYQKLVSLTASQAVMPITGSTADHDTLQRYRQAFGRSDF